MYTRVTDLLVCSTSCYPNDGPLQTETLSNIKCDIIKYPRNKFEHFAGLVS